MELATRADRPKVRAVPSILEHLKLLGPGPDRRSADVFFELLAIASTWYHYGYRRMRQHKSQCDLRRRDTEIVREAADTVDRRFRFYDPSFPFALAMVAGGEHGAARVFA